MYNNEFDILEKYLETCPKEEKYTILLFIVDNFMDPKDPSYPNPHIKEFLKKYSKELDYYKNALRDNNPYREESTNSKSLTDAKIIKYIIETYDQETTQL